ncbi:MAG: MFS transporter [Thioclava marina]|uniref:MFS transporter n=1 Tax=Thioclava marina TaxID=1915077 RepID=A0ABX3MQF2_9RHOB|nr:MULTISPECIES: MFS transporter [Thioclava]TNE83579.1 MAG: MFS transporter [Paracoccaceae bacterium]MBC7146917.1 MFS transporter [Thioclava marina]MBD3802679.1 MFS transporter [Thioclava sp.]OOY13768.1 MFS transporter [Thioclava marina]OOY29477.1 MFS transporter [Thioclava sp. L04-15]
MELQNKATSLWPNFFNVTMVQIRTFHMTWFAFFACFFAWFGIAPLMAVVRDELHLTKSQVGWAIIGSVSMTIFARLFIGWLVDRIGPRKSYTWLLILGSLPVMGIGLAHDFTTFLIFRILIGGIGASFVITQYHTSVMFASNVVGQANATSAGWGNLGGGVTQFVMPLLFSVFVVGFGFSEALGWRLSMVVVGVIIFLIGIGYYFLTQDAPDGNYDDLRARGMMPEKKTVTGAYWTAMADYRVWMLFVIYGACFGIELTINNVAALYFADYFNLSLVAAGLVAASFGLMNIFARTLGGLFGDNFGSLWGLRGRSFWLFMCLLFEGIALMIFSQMQVLFLALPSLIVFSLFTQMAEGATYSVVPFINKKALGAVAGVVGAGGNAGAVLAGFLFKGAMDWHEAFLILGMVVTAASFLAFFVRFSTRQEDEERAAFAIANIQTLRKRADKANAELEHALNAIETRKVAVASA